MFAFVLLGWVFGDYCDVGLVYCLVCWSLFECVLIYWWVVWVVCDLCLGVLLGGIGCVCCLLATFEGL